MLKVGDTAHSLKIWREVAEIKQRDLANLTGLHNSTISSYESGSSDPHPETVQKVSAALGMTPVDLEETENFVRRVRSRLLPPQLGQSPQVNPLLDSRRELLIWKEETDQVIREGSRFAGRLLHLVLGLLVSIAEAVVERGDSKPGKLS